MAVLKQRNDGDFYIVQGYPITAHGSEDVRFASYEVSPRANSFFADNAFRDADPVPRELFYLLLLQQDISNTATQGTAPSFKVLPRPFVNQVGAMSRNPSFLSVLREQRFLKCRHFFDFFRVFAKRPKNTNYAGGPQGAPFLNKKDFGLKYGLKGAALDRAHLQYRKPFATLAFHAPRRPAKRQTGVITQRDYGIKFGLKGQALKKAHKKYLASLSITGNSGLPSHRKRHKDIEQAASLCLVWHYLDAHRVRAVTAPLAS